MKRIPWVLAGVLLSTACGSNGSNVERPRGLVDDQGRARLVTPPPPPVLTQPAPMPVQNAGNEPSSLPSPFDAPAADPGALAAPSGGTRPSETPKPQPAGADSTQPQRDLSAELRALLGQPATCLDLARAANSGGKIALHVEASVTAEGRVLRASVSAPGQEASAGRCLEQRVRAGSLKGGIADAPRDISADLTLDVVGQKPASTAATPPGPPRGVELAKPEPGEMARPEPLELAQPSQ